MSLSDGVEMAGVNEVESPVYVSSLHWLVNRNFRAFDHLLEFRKRLLGGSLGFVVTDVALACQLAHELLVFILVLYKIPMISL